MRGEEVIDAPAVRTVDDLKGIKFRAYNATLEKFANAVGAAIAQVSGEIDQIFNGLTRDEAIAEADVVHEDTYTVPRYAHCAIEAHEVVGELADGTVAYALEGAIWRGFTLTDIDPDVVVVGETQAFNWSMIQKASYFIMNGARFIATNPDVAGPKGHPACGALCAPIERIRPPPSFSSGPCVCRQPLPRRVD